MKKLLGVIGILALAAVLVPASGYADLRGSFAPITIASGFVNGCEQSAYRPIDPGGIMDAAFTIGFDGGRHDSEWTTFSTRSLVPGHEQVRSIWLHLNSQQSAYFAPLLNDPSANVSYFDPCWSDDASWLAYIQQNSDGTGQALYIQQYMVNDDINSDHGGFYPPGQGAEDKIGPPILVVGGSHPRHPNFKATHSGSVYTLAYDDDAAGTQDLYTIDVDVAAMTAAAPVRRTFDNAHAESDPSFGPAPGNTNQILFCTSQFGPKVIEVLDTSLPSNDPNYTKLAEVNFNFVTHGNPDWAGDGHTIYYDAPTGENPSSVSDVWQFDMTAQAKCEIQFDIRADADPDVSGVLQHTRAPDNIPYYYFLMTSQAGGFGVAQWRANAVNSCTTPLTMACAISPSKTNFKSQQTVPFMTTMHFPAETKALGYVCRSGNTGGEGVRCRSSIFFSPTLLGLGCPTNSDFTPPGGTPVSNTECFDEADTTQISPLVTDRKIVCYWDRRTIIDRITALGLLDQTVPLKMTAYSNLTGRPFVGFAYLQVTKNNLSGGSVAMLGNSPNPFNPVTTIKFAVSNAGNYALRIYDVQGKLVKTLANKYYGIGVQEAMWDGRNANGGKVASGVYYAKISGTGVSDAGIARMVITK